MTGQPRPRRDRSSALIAGTLAVGLFAGVAVANPAAFDRSIDRAWVAIFGAVDHGRGDTRPRGPDGGGATTHTPDECAALVEGFRRASPALGDARGIEHAIEVVEANCEKNPKAKGLLNALKHLLANADRHALHESNSGGNGHGNGRGRGTTSGHGNGHENGHANGHGGGRGH